MFATFCSSQSPCSSCSLVSLANSSALVLTVLVIFSYITIYFCGHVCCFCILAAYALQVRFRPFQTPSDHPNIVQDHAIKAMSAGLHASVAAAIRNASARPHPTAPPRTCTRAVLRGLSPPFLDAEYACPAAAWPCVACYHQVEFRGRKVGRKVHMRSAASTGVRIADTVMTHLLDYNTVEMVRRYVACVGSSCEVAAK